MLSHCKKKRAFGPQIPPVLFFHEQPVTKFKTQVALRLLHDEPQVPLVTPEMVRLYCLGMP
jgi:hypothetical protein